MVRRVNPRSRKPLAGVLLFLAFGAVLWHVLACRESPMAFSPDGRRLAFVTMEPYDGDIDKDDKHMFRLMVLTDGKNLRIVEQTDLTALSAPAFSPDGRQICYLRLPLEKPQAPAGQAAAPAAPEEEKPTLNTENRTLPDAEALLDLKERPTIGAALIVCDAGSFKVLHHVPIQLLDPAEPGINYVIQRPQYSPDGQWIYLCAGQQLIRVDPRDPKQETLAIGAHIARLSPDGKTIAFLGEESLGIMDADGRVAIYRRWEANQPSLCGLTWKDNQTIAVLSAPPEGEVKPALHLFKADGSWLSTNPVNVPDGSGEANTGDLAIAPDSLHIVISYGHSVLFMNAAGEVRAIWKTKDEEGKEPGKEGWLVQPTFTPDSKQVAFKQLAEDGPLLRTKAIVFFGTDGKEHSRVAIPPAERTGDGPM